MDNNSGLNHDCRCPDLHPNKPYYAKILICISLLIALSACRKNSTSELINAARKGDSDTLKVLLDKDIDVNLQDEKGWTALTWAAYQGHKNIVKLLLARNATLNLKDNMGMTTLMWAARQGYGDIAKALLDKGADVNAADKYGTTALIMAIESGKTEMARILTNRNAYLLLNKSLISSNI